MLYKKKALGYLISSIILSFSLSACGNDSPILPTDTTLTTASQIQAVAPACTCPTAQPTPEATSTPVVKKPIKNKSKKSTTATTTSTPSRTSTPSPVATVAPVVSTNPADKGRLILNKMMDKITSANAFETEVEKYEKSLTDGKVVQQTFKIDERKSTGDVKIDVLYHTTSSSIGAKLHFVVGSGKITVRPGGALSFITKELDQTDSNIVSANGYTPEKVDLLTLAKRFSDTSYKAELTGKTTIDGNDVYILKITNSETNTLDPRIKFETLGFDPKTFEVKLWEVYSASSETEPFMRITMKSFTVLDSIPDSTFKV
ncbi:MAG: hypothetical protein H7263_09000 [Candidatus Sericytochromatia bacterium]|nr:hypothetical protein [Candidatus Sericytochromatia bacterium]